MPPGPDDDTIRLDIARGVLIEDRFKIVQSLGAGAMGNVFHARDLKFDRKVALKFLSADHIASETSWQRLVREARVIADLEHPNIVRLVDYGRSPYGPFLAMELVEGRSLKELVGKMNHDLESVVAIIVQVVSAVAAAHGRKVIHRDIKPANIHVRTDGTVKVLDFGIAHILGREHLTKSAPIMSLAYAAPEQQQGEARERSDLFSIGCVFYELLCGEHPFLQREMNLFQLIDRMRSGRHRPIPASAGELSPILERLLAPDPAYRPESARELLALLESWRDARRMPIRKAPQHAGGAFAMPPGAQVNAVGRRAAFDVGVHGIAEIFLSRNEFDVAYDLEQLLAQVANGGRMRVIGKTLLLLLGQDELLKRALVNGCNIELALVDPRAGEALFRKIPDVHMDDLAPAVRHYASIARWLETEPSKPAGSFEVRYHDEPLTDSFTQYEGGTNRVIWELSFGQSRNSKRVLVLDPSIGIGFDVASRYRRIWEDARPQFRYADGHVSVPLPRDLHEFATHRRAETAQSPERAARRVEFDIRPAMANDLAWMGELERKYFNESAVPTRLLREWYGANPTGFSVLKVMGGPVIGFLNILPLRAEALNRLKNGQIAEKDLRRAMLYRPAERDGVREIYIESLVVDAHRPRALRYLLAHVQMLIRGVCIPERVRRIYALAASEEGAELLAHLNFKPYLRQRGRKDGLRMYSIKTFDLVMSCSKYLDDDDHISDR